MKDCIAEAWRVWENGVKWAEARSAGLWATIRILDFMPMVMRIHYRILSRGWQWGDQL